MTSTLQQAAFQKAEIGAFRDLHQFEFNAPFLPTPMKGKVFLKELLGLTSMEVSVNQLPVGGAMPFWHKHTNNEEVYIFISGQGQFMINDDCFDVQEGTAISVQPEANRVWRNTSETEPLVYLVLQAKKGTMEAGTIEDGVGVDAPVVWS